MNKEIKVLQTVGSGNESVYVYYFESLKKDERWPCKIGFAKNSVEKRIKQQSASMLEAPILGIVIKTKSGGALESFVHSKLKNKRIKSFGDEWFLTNPKEVEEIALKANFNNNSLNIGEAIRLLRIDKNLTQQELSKLTGVRQETISMIENGSNTRFETVEKIIQSLGKKITVIDCEV
jgi:DNA-binding XRE family transcriptional regulator